MLEEDLHKSCEDYANASGIHNNTVVLSENDVVFLENHGVEIKTQKRIRKRIEKMSSPSFETYKLGLIVAKCLQKMDIETGICIYHIILSTSYTRKITSIAKLLGSIFVQRSLVFV